MKIIQSNQARLEIDSTTTKKIFYKKSDYLQEKYFLLKLNKASNHLVPKIFSWNDISKTIVMETLHGVLDETISPNTKKGYVAEVIKTMGKLWYADINIAKKYTYTGDRISQRIHSFLYKKTVEQVTNKPQLINNHDISKWAKGYSNLLTQGLSPTLKTKTRKGIIHFDLSPRNIFLQNNDVKIIDWGRAIYSYVFIDISILLAKFELKIHEINSKEERIIIDQSLADSQAIESLSQAFNIYRLSKRNPISLSQCKKEDMLFPLSPTKY